MTIMQQRRREGIESFCREFLSGDVPHLHDIISKYRDSLAQIDLDLT